jgi:hypothetical protein
LQGFLRNRVGLSMKAITTIAFATLATACGTVDPAPNPTPDEPTREFPSIDDEATPKVFPASCADVLTDVPTATDGDFTLYIGGDESKPWQAYCADMATAPKEYLPLVMVLGDHNYSQYTAGGASPGSSVRTSYLRLRIDPATLTVDIGDQAFAMSSGSLSHSFNEAVSSMPFGVAMSCDGTASGRADIDLRGTPFTLGSTFSVHGSGSSGTTTVDTTLRQASLNGGGGCGWLAIDGAPFNPFNAAHGSVLQLVYTP